MSTLSSELINQLTQNLFTAVIGDVMDQMGLTRQFLPAGIRPLDPSCKMAGFALPVLEADCTGTRIASENRDAAFGKLFAALDDLREGEVYVCTGSSHDYALWGELMTVRAEQLKSVGAVVDGFCRDSQGVLKRRFPVFSAGTYSQDQGVRGRVIDYRCDITFRNGTVVSPGDIVFGDVDGVVIIPQQKAHEVIDAASEKVSGENTVLRALQSGMSAAEAFAKYGIM